MEIIMFTCIECKEHYAPDIDGDSEERTCCNCLNGVRDHGMLDEWRIKYKSE